jgi:hypothetical protein
MAAKLETLASPWLHRLKNYIPNSMWHYPIEFFTIFFKGKQ